MLLVDILDQLSELQPKTNLRKDDEWKGAPFSAPWGLDKNLFFQRQIQSYEYK